MTAFINHFLFEFRTGIRNKQLLMMNYLFPLGFFLMMGFVMAAVNPLFLDTMTPAMAVFAVLAATLLGIPEPLVNARENGIFRSYKINGVPSFSILVITALTTMLHLLIVTVIITVAGPLLFDAPSPVNWLNYALIFAALAFVMSGISVLIGVVSSNSRVTILYSQLFFIPSILLAGMMFPYNMLPAAAGKIAQLLPATQAMNAFNGLAMGGVADFNPWVSVITMIASGVLAFGLAVYLFSWDSRNTARRGHPLLALLILLPFVIGWLGGPSLEGTQWTLVTLEGKPPLAGTALSAEFSADQISGSAGCNHYFGAYTVSGSDVTIGDVGSTEMYCMDPEGVMDQEQAFLAVLASANSYRLAGTRLELLDATGGVILTFEPPAGFKQYQDSVTGVSIYVPEGWVVTGIVPGEHAILQSYPEDKYAGGGGQHPGDTKCDLSIRPPDVSLADAGEALRSDSLATIVSEQEIILQSGEPGIRREVESMGPSISVYTEVNERAVLLTCFGEFALFDQIALTLGATE